MSESETGRPENGERTLLEGLLHYISILWKHRLLIAGVTAAGAIGAVVFSIISLQLPPEKSPLPNIYSAYATVVFTGGGGSGGTASILSALGMDLPGQASTTNFPALAMQVLQSRSLQDRIIERTNLLDHYSGTFETQEDLRAIVSDNTQMDYNRDTGILTIGYRHIDPEYAQQVANALVEELESWFIERGGISNQQQVRSMQEKLVEVEQEIARLEEQIREFQEEHGVLRVQEISETQSALLRDLRSQLVELDLQIQSQEQLTRIENDPTLNRMRVQRQNTLEQIRQIEAGFSGGVRTMPARSELPQLAMELGRLEMDLEIQQRVYQALSQQYEVARLTSEGESVFTVMERAEVPQEKSEPSRAELCVIVTVIAFMLSVVAALGIETVQNIAKDPEKRRLLEAGKRNVTRCAPAAVLLFAAVALFSQEAPDTVPLPRLGSQQQAASLQQADAAAPAAGAATGLTVAEQRLQLAVADPNYPVTPGDRYALSYSPGNERVTTAVLVESDYTVDLGLMGSIDAEGMAITALKIAVADAVESAYPRSIPSLRLQSVGIFEVTLTGAIPQTTRVVAWGMSRLSELVQGRRAPYTSVRNITVLSRNGQRRPYDLFRALNQGQITQDPYLKPGDRIQFQQVERTVQVTGEVNEPGRYELLPEEDITDLFRFVRGLTQQADEAEMRLQRDGGAEYRRFTFSMDEGQSTELQNGDVIIVPATTAAEKVVYMEGAINLDISIEPETDEDTLFEVYNRETLPYTPGTTLRELLLDVREQISPFADLTRGRLKREGVPGEMHIDMRRLIYEEEDDENIELQPFDTVIIPTQESYVLVTGGVNDPGRYPFEVGRSYSYYVRLAGGFDTEVNKDGAITVTDAAGNLRSPDQLVQAGDTIEAARNDFRYNFNQYFPIISTGLTFITTIVNIITLINN